MWLEGAWRESADRSIRRLVRQHDVDIKHLLRRASQYEGQPWPPSGNGMAGVTDQGFFRLQGPANTGLFRNQTMAAARLRMRSQNLVATTEIVTLRANSLVRGYFLPGDDVQALLMDSQWWVIGTGLSYVSGTNTTEIAKGSSAVRNVDNGNSVTILARFDRILAGKRFGAWWDEASSTWHASGECP